MSFKAPICLLYLGLGGVVLTALPGCQPDRAAQRPEPATAPALADTLALDSVTTPVSAAPVQRTWHHVARPTAKRAPLVVYRRGVRRPAGMSAAALPAEARLQDLTLKASEYFQIDPTRPAEVRGREGTVVRIPAGALVNSRQQPAAGAVWVELKECYTASDLLLSNLLTETAAGVPLELAGAVLVRATAGGQQLALAAGRTVQLELAGARQPHLFYGQAGPADAVRWTAGEEAAPASEQVYTTAEQMPRYGRGPADINRLIRYPRQAQESRTEGLVFASFVVDETGRVTSPRILRGLGNGCDEEVLRVLRQTSGRWTPGQHEGRFVKVKLVLPIRFALQEEGLASTTTEASPPADAETAPPPSEELPEAPAALRISRLGWVAGGEPWTETAASLLVPAAPDANTALRLLVPGRRVVLAGQPRSGGYEFGATPAAAQYVLVGLRYENGTPFLARHDAQAGSAPPDSLQFRETTLADLETVLARLD
ncbi:energy transducer TonB [Hymenobacter weizhouensis]|uniref:energy transducer TonB n=1 Tax=Hymenobacter sp. YIM 151500-1 TaxID=2987689 RepID=UPI0022275E74|nr:energy transducer TonB [Hymenobacter sp. YIM 151500-1]UYZ62103.1 energy transducer TonB [Hymenobacter sp. YIM 151500-1]